MVPLTLMFSKRETSDYCYGTRFFVRRFNFKPISLYLPSMIYCPIVSKIHYIEILNTVPTWYCKYKNTEFSFDLKNNSRYLGFYSQQRLGTNISVQIWSFDMLLRVVPYFTWICILLELTVFLIKSKSNFDTKPQAVVYFIWIITLN